MEMKMARLIMVTDKNNYKFYYMSQVSEKEFKAEWGRIEVNHYEKMYPIERWDSIYYSKLRKGYVDQTNLDRVRTEKEEVMLYNIENQDVKALIINLHDYVKNSILRNYDISSNGVTLRRVENAQQIIDDIANHLSLDSDIDFINKKYLELLGVITRRLQRVQDILFDEINIESDLEKAQQKIAEEQAILDVIRGEIETRIQASETGEKSILEQFGLEIRPCTVEEDQMIKEMMESDAKAFSRAFRVIHKQNQTEFDSYVNNSEDRSTRLFWHGSRNENWWNILKTGLVLRPANAVITGKLFGYGIYFTDKFRKALKYSSCRGSYLARGTEDTGFLALFNVHTGHQFHIKEHENWCYNINEANLKNYGDYDSVFAEGIPGIRDNDYVIYTHDQCTIEYLVEVNFSS
ncbi:MAG: ADP-ribose polymerase [Candidatus Hodarchaeota archaeon]